MRLGATDSDAYLEGWRQSDWDERGGSPEEVAQAVANELESEFGETRVMASDGRNTGNPKFEGFALSLNAKTEADADRLFNALSSGGKVTMPMSKTFFSPRFGMCADKFGMQWMIIVE